MKYMQVLVLLTLGMGCMGPAPTGPHQQSFSEIGRFACRGFNCSVFKMQIPGFLFIKIELLKEGVSLKKWLGSRHPIFPCVVVGDDNKRILPIGEPQVCEYYIPAEFDVEIATAAILKPDSEGVLLYKFSIVEAPRGLLKVVVDLGGKKVGFCL